MYAREKLPELKYRKRDHLMNKMIGGLRFRAVDDTAVIPSSSSSSATAVSSTNKMSSSSVDSKIDILDTREELEKKIKRVYCVVGNVTDNSLLDLLDSLIFKLIGEEFHIKREDRHGGDVKYTSIEAIRSDFASGVLHPMDLKRGMTDAIYGIISQISLLFNKSGELRTPATF